MQRFNTAAFYTLGCKLNFAETSTIARNLKDAGYAKVPFDSGAGVYVINTCSVTDNADKKCRNVIRRALRKNPDAKIVVIGCYAQLKPDEISKIEGVNLVLGANEKFNVARHLEALDFDERGTVKTGRIGKGREFFPSYSHGDRTRTFFKVQDGCDYYCSFCTIPLARGKSRSNNITTTIQKARELEAKNIKEVVLTGVNTGDYGAGSDENFFMLIQELEKLNIPRFRISSIEPNLLHNEIIKFSARSPSFVPHFHVPLQSGSDYMLKIMKRKYGTELYAGRVQTIKREMPDACIGVDVIVGHPGETDEEFMKTYNFLNELDVSYLHVFTYSERPNTVAEKFGETVPMQQRHERSKMLRILSEKKKRAFYESQCGKEKTVLWEGEKHACTMHGFTENYVKVKAPYNEEKVNTFERVRLTQPDRDGIMQVKVMDEKPIVPA